LKEQKWKVRAVDRKPLSDWYPIFPEADSRQLDLQELPACRKAIEGCDYIHNLAADMGGRGFTENNKALCIC